MPRSVAEQVRQRVAATQFVADGQPIQATVTVHLTQVAASHTATNLLEFLEETLEEAKRFGGNRTFMHDGTSPTPVVPPELNVAPRLQSVCDLQRRVYPRRITRRLATCILAL